MCKSYREDTGAVKVSGKMFFLFFKILLLAFLKTFDQVLLREAELPGHFIVLRFPASLLTVCSFGECDPPQTPLLLVNLLIMCFSF